MKIRSNPWHFELKRMVYSPADEARLLNELKATGVNVGLLINFGMEKVPFKRIAPSRQRMM